MQVCFPQQDSRFNQEIDKKTGYRTRSILCMPILDHYHDEVQYNNLGLDESRILERGFWGVVVGDPRESEGMLLRYINSRKIYCKVIWGEGGGGGSWAGGPNLGGVTSGLMVTTLDSRSSILGSSPSQEHFVVFLGKTLLSQCLYLRV